MCPPAVWYLIYEVKGNTNVVTMVNIGFIGPDNNGGGEGKK